jgi:hypothetical protein
MFAKETDALLELLGLPRIQLHLLSTCAMISSMLGTTGDPEKV